MLSALLDWDFAQLIYHQNLALQNTSKNTETFKAKKCKYNRIHSF